MPPPHPQSLMVPPSVPCGLRKETTDCGCRFPRKFWWIISAPLICLPGTQSPPKREHPFLRNYCYIVESGNCRVTWLRGLLPLTESELRGQTQGFITEEPRHQALFITVGSSIVERKSKQKSKADVGGTPSFSSHFMKWFRNPWSLNLPVQMEVMRRMRTPYQKGRHSWGVALAFSADLESSLIGRVQLTLFLEK